VTQGTKQKDRTLASASDEEKEGPRTKIVTRTIAWFTTVKTSNLTKATYCNIWSTNILSQAAVNVTYLQPESFCHSIFPHILYRSDKYHTGIHHDQSKVWNLHLACTALSKLGSCTSHQSTLLHSDTPHIYRSHDQHTADCFHIYMIGHYIDSTFHSNSVIWSGKLADLRFT
jgi:hypothetical protein